jgi:Asp-tRNA(Asn)/Glu-tRNA(Gln) amidotransferase B subunit
MGLAQVSDAAAIDAAVRAVLAQQSEAVARYRAGNPRILGFLVAEVVRRMEGRGNPKLAAGALRRLLAGPDEEDSHG